MTKAIGIDLGCDRCTVAVVQEGAPRLLGEPIPTAVAFNEDGMHVGHDALPIADANPMHFFDSFLRLMGRKFHSAEVDWLQACSPYVVGAGANGDALLNVDSRDYSPQELCSYVLEAAKRQAEDELGLDVASAVVTVPATFDHVHRKAVMDAASLAGLEVGRLLNNTTAGAVGYAGLGSQHKRAAIVDVGAGSFEVSLVEIEGGTVKVLASAGDPLLGGADIDRRLVMRFLERAYEQSEMDLSVVPAALSMLQDRARRTKHRLSKVKKSEAFEIDLPTGDGNTVSFYSPGVTRRELVELAEQELASMKDPILWAFEDAELGTDDLDEVVVMGGSTRLPALRSAFKYLFRNKPYRPGIADVMVAFGAARVADAQLGGGVPIQLQDVASCSNGIKVRAGRFAPLILRNRPLPCRVVKVFQSARRGKQRIMFELYQGENELATDNTYLGRFRLDEVPGDGRFPVAFQMDESGLLSVSAVDVHNNEERPVPLQLAGGLTEADMAELAAQRAERARPSSLPDPSAPVPMGRRITSIGGGTMRIAQPVVNESPSKRFSKTQRPMPVASGRQATGTLVMQGAPGAAKSVRPGTLKSQTESAGAYGKGAIEVGADSLVGTTLENRYRIDSILADGGMGRVYLAEHTFLGKRFAIKVLHPELCNNREITARFIREARAASSIKSDHVVDISDFGSLEDGTGYFVMEFLDGRTLEEALDRDGPMRAAMVRSIGIQVADGLRGAHDCKIVHRDLKPANIVLTERKDHPHYCKILDFGIAKSPTSDSGGGQTLVTMVGVMMGTPHYMAPEQIDGVAVDGRSDIYALGIVLFEMATGLPPFDAESVAEVLAQHKWGEVPAIHETCPDADCPRALEAVIRKCLEKSPDDRYQTASELAEALASC
jgi:molecular chaperone DnaK